MNRNPLPLDLQASVIVPAFNAAGVLPACLRALEHQTLPRSMYEVIVVDDGSTDDTAALAEAAGVGVVRIAHAGAAAARNAGVVAARAPVVVFTDADCEPAPDFLERLLQPLAAATVSGARGVYRSGQRSWIARFIQLEYEERYQRIAHYEARHGTVDALDTSYCAYRRKVFLDAGGFDTRFGSAAGEDHELSYRMAHAGHVFRFAPLAAVYHHHVEHMNAYARRKFRIGFWKAFLTRQHPAYALADAHTTQSLKAQIVLLPLLALAVLLWPFWPGAALVAAGSCLLFLISAVPLLWLIARRDPAILVVALPLLGARAAMAGLGFLWGLVRARPPTSHLPARLQAN